jgi:hypothetical protein
MWSKGGRFLGEAARSQMAMSLAFPSCGGSDARSDLEQAISERLAGFIQEEQLPYVVSQEPAFI